MTTTSTRRLFLQGWIDADENGRISAKLYDGSFAVIEIDGESLTSALDKLRDALRDEKGIAAVEGEMTPAAPDGAYEVRYTVLPQRQPVFHYRAEPDPRAEFERIGDMTDGYTAPSEARDRVDGNNDL